jgi:hypothetical protein
MVHASKLLDTGEKFQANINLGTDETTKAQWKKLAFIDIYSTAQAVCSFLRVSVVGFSDQRSSAFICGKGFYFVFLRALCG